MTELKNKLHNLKFRLSYYYSTYAFEKNSGIDDFHNKKNISLKFPSLHQMKITHSEFFFPIDTIGDISCLPRSVVNAYYFIVIQL